MSYIFDEEPTTFTVTIKNIKMEYPITERLLRSCNHWVSTILNEKKIELDDMNLNGVHDFFDGIINKKINFTNENCQTILKLSEISGSTKISEQVKIFINHQKPAQDILKELIKENETNKINNTDEDNIKDQQDKEIYLGIHYNEILSFPELLKNIEISQHYRIVQYAINNNQDQFDYHKYITFVIDLIEEDHNKKYNILLSNIDMKYFDIEQLKRLCQNRNFDENVLQHKVINFITKMREQERQLHEQEELTRKLQTQIKEYQTQNRQMIDEIKNLIKQEQQNIEEQIKTITNNQTQTQNENKHKIEEIKQIITNQTQSMNEIKQQNKQIIDEKFDSLLSEMKKKIDDCNKENKHQTDEIKQIINNQQKSINEIKQQNTQIETLFKDQQTSINEIKQQTKKIIEDKSTTIISELKKELDINHIKNEFSTITTIQNNTSQEIKEIQNKVNNLPSFIEQNQGMKAEIIRNKQNDNSQQTSQKMTEIQNKLIEISKEIKQIDLYYSGMILRRDYLGESFSGIISKLTKSHGTNINDEGVISITGNRYGNGTYSSLVDYNYSNLSYYSCNDQNSFICFDFKDYCISLSAYSIKSSNNSISDFLKSWTVEGSNGENEWIELDSHSNEETLCTKSVIRTFHICKEKRIKQPFKFIRLRITGPNSKNRYFIEITNIEFFGKYYKR